MTIRNPFRKRPEKKAASAPAPSTRTTGSPVSRLDPDIAQQAVFYTPPATRSDDCGTSSPSASHHSGGGSHHSYDSGSSHSSYDSGSHSSGSYDSGSSGCDSGGGF
ncbi:MAG TPA: hypothetical protein VHA75_00050 [Rugosimonospora sp.]|nr:hypothetical protein [Rugosimonospora sp.]